jgi:hypothetical protein
MRFYDIIISDPNSGKVIQSSALTGTSQKSTFTSYVNGKTLPGALNIEVDIPQAPFGLPGQGGASIRVWGISRTEISQATNFANKDVVVYCGMKKGLPLAKPEQSQMPLIRGMISQAFGNWQGNEQSLDFVVIPRVGRSNDRSNFSFIWKANTPIADMIKTVMSAAIPDARVETFISDSVKYDYDQPGFYGSLLEFAQAIKTLTNVQRFAGIKTTGGLPYGGVECATKSSEDGLYVFYDNTKGTGGAKEISPGQQELKAEPAMINGMIGVNLTPSGPPSLSQIQLTQVDFSDIIGQPTWIGPNEIQFKTVMRSDITIAEQIKLPEAILPLQLLNPKSAPKIDENTGQLTASRQKSSFQGVFQVKKIHHFGNFRQADAGSWVTVINAVFNADYGKKEEEDDGPPGQVEVGQPTKVDAPSLEAAVPAPSEPPPVRIEEFQSTVTNPTPPNIVNPLDLGSGLAGPAAAAIPAPPDAGVVPPTTPGLIPQLRADASPFGFIRRIPIRRV